MPDSLAFLRSTAAIRDRAHRLLERGVAGQLEGFSVHLDRLPAVADLVVEVTRRRYPSLAIPVHSRWRHFDVGGVPRLAELATRLAGLDPVERARTRLDLAITSVLLDAGAGPRWAFREPGVDGSFARSEGLAVASYHLFVQGHLSSDPATPLRADAAGLSALDEATLARVFQVSETNPLEGLVGRARLLRSLGGAIKGHPSLFGRGTPRPGGLVDAARARATDGQLRAHELLSMVLEGLAAIWPGRVSFEGVNLGDVWVYPALGEGETERLMPLHKLSQWLTYSLVEPLEETGLRITHLDELTGLAEYRNGGLFLDGGVLTLLDPTASSRPHEPGSPLIVEWRALTVALLDRLAPLVRERLGLTAEAFPLGNMLEGGTWAAGRELAARLRDGSPPLAIVSDGTVF